MIENLQGIKEIVNFKAKAKIRLYLNNEYEEYPTHWHSPLEIIMPLEKCYHVTCCKDLFTLNEGDILLINPGVIHSMKAEAGKRLILQADYALLHSIKELETTLSTISPAIIITSDDEPETHEKIKQLMIEISNEYFSDAPLTEAAIYSKLIEIYVLIGRSNIPNTKSTNININKQREYTERFMNICDYINEHYSEDLTLDYVAKISGFSKYHFSRLFKQFTNISYYKYLNKKRIENAEKMLIDKELTITDIALRCGFSNLSSFIRMFKIMNDCTPSEFKSMYTT